jgi:hypothetical protein
MLLLLLSLVSAAPPAAASEMTLIPGTRISLAIPEGFALSEVYPGIVSEKAFTSVMVSEVPTPLPVMRMSLTREKLAAGGMELLGTETLSAAGTEAILVHARQMAGGNVFEKWILVFGNRSSTVSLVATTPAVMADRFAAPLRRSLLSARWTPGKSVDAFEGLGYSLADTAGLGVVDRISNMVFLTRPPGDAPTTLNDPLFVIGSITRVGKRRSGLAEFAQQRVTRIAEIKNVELVSGEEFSLDGLRAYQTFASAEDVETSAPIRVYQVLAEDGGRYVLMQGLVGAELAHEYFPQFQRIAASFRNGK